MWRSRRYIGGTPHEVHGVRTERDGGRGAEEDRRVQCEVEREQADLWALIVDAEGAGKPNATFTCVRCERQAPSGTAGRAGDAVAECVIGVG